MENTSPEKTMAAVRQAAIMLETRGVLDRNFPDLRKTFTDPPQYISPQLDVVKPFVVKKSVTIPSPGIEAIRQYQPYSPSGFATSINRAYFVVKNILYLWDFVDTPNLVTYEEEEDIVGIGFVTPKPGIFRDDIKHLMVVSTISEVKIMALEYTSTKQLRVHKTDMTTNTAGVNMISIVGTQQGRIFMLGDDGYVWELDYRPKETWFSSKCTKKLHSTGNNLYFLIGSFTKDPVTEIAVNEDGTVLYQLTASSSIYVTYLAKDGHTFNTVFRKTDMLHSAQTACPSAQHLTADNFKLISIQPTTASESKSYHLVAISSSGLRIYLSHHTESHHLVHDAPPNTLAVVHVRSAGHTLTAADSVSRPLYHNGLFMFVKNAQQNAAVDTIVTYSPDLGKLSNCVSPASDMALTENHSTLDIHGKVLAIVESTHSNSEINNMALPYYSIPRTFLILATTGLTVLVQQRPVDMLYRLLYANRQDTIYRLPQFEDFYTHFGFVNCASLCYNLICSNVTIVSGQQSAHSPAVVSDAVERGATTLLDQYGKIPSHLNTIDQHAYSSRHDGLALFIYRLVQPIWEQQLIQTTIHPDGSKIYTHGPSTEQLKSVKTGLDKLVSFMDTNHNLFKSAAGSPETESFSNLRELAAYLRDAFCFFVYLIEAGVPSVIQLMSPVGQARVLQQDLKTLLTTSEGRTSVNDLLSALIQFSFTRFDNTSYVIDILTQHCGSFCGASDVLLYKAANQIYSARTAINTSQARAILNDSLLMLVKIAAHIPAEKALEIADEYASQGYPTYGIRLALECAKKRNKSVLTEKQPFYDIVFKLVSNAISKKSNMGNAATHEAYRKEILDAVFNNNDKEFQFYFYEAFVNHKLGQELIEESPPYLEEFLKLKPTYDRLGLLGDFYRRNQRYEEAAITYVTLARAEGDIDMGTRIENLTTAAACANAVTTPSKQYEMFHLKNEIEQLLKVAM
ncbi:hypothetical protein A0J61_02381 [Choanephora cucurbitarum]|uniref:Nucleoporin-domain-containing protein n=1 Tax=Choanephora cucurbitarum TaxID=101091 RepID=A0A1C7NL60_9FUNG|nr:hypothetical protein A0J61_02381 [Choanephora cucurbitarum]